MKRTSIALALLLISTAALAADPQRYIVAMKQPLRDSAPGVLRGALGTDFEPRAVSRFETFRGFAAELTESEVAELRRSNAVRWVEPVVERHALAVQRNPNGQTVPAGIDVVRANYVWPARRSGEVNVVVIDSGVDFNHPDLKEIWMGGYNAFDDGTVPRDDNGHGTHVAGTIAATDNEIGVVGVAPHVRLWGAKVLNAKGTGTSEGLMKAIEWVIAQKKEHGGNWVVNLSLGAKDQSNAEREVYQRAIGDGIIVIAAAGNDSKANKPAPVLYPAGYPGVIAVGALNGRTAIASFSSQGPEVAVAAPGVDVLSTLPVGSNFSSHVLDGSTRYPTYPLIGSKVGNLSGDYVYCGLGAPEDFPAEVRGRIALMKRGGNIPFANKTRNAMAAGAIAVVIFNHDASPLNWTLIIESDPETAKINWPVALSMSLEHGEALAKKGSGTIAIKYESDDYGVLAGTSMASPHVAGAAALLWTLAPTASAGTIVNALLTTAIDLGEPGRDPAFGAGAIDVAAAAWLLAPEAFEGVPNPRPTTGRRALRRGGK